METKNKRGEILIEDIVFLILNLAFLSILVFFLVKQSSGTIVLEELYAKQISLMIDSAEKDSRLILDISEGFQLAEKNGVIRENIISINGNNVKVKLSPDSGYEYSFFNNLDLSEGFFEEDGKYVLSILGESKNE